MFFDWLVFSAKKVKYDKYLKKDKKEEIRAIHEIFCKETAYALLGRILFARICEDKELLRDATGRTLQFISGKGLADYLRVESHRLYKDAFLTAMLRVYKNMEEFYKHAYVLNAFFDWWRLEPSVKGTLTENDLGIQEDLERELNYVLMHVLKRLNRFDFGRLDRDLLKDVYQHYLPPAERKQLGEFYTPDVVIKYILDHVGYTLDNSIENKDLIDPACGSGGFLFEATRRLMDRYKAKGMDLDDPDVAKEVLESIRERIYGLDIHPFACFIAEMNLLFQVIDLYARVREKYRRFSLKEFQIYRTDSLISGSPHMDLETFMAENHTVRIAVEELKKAEKVKKRTFDFVVGNPPYVRVDNISSEFRREYKETYEDLLVGKWDIYIPFVFRGMEWLNPDGKFGYIVSDKFFVLEQGLPLREHILDHFNIDEIVDLSGIKVFAESLPSPAIIIAHRKKSNKHRIRVDVKNDNDVPESLKEDIKSLDKLIALERVLGFLLRNIRYYEVFQDRFKEDPEKLFTVTIPDYLHPLIQKIEKNCINLGDLCEGEIGEGDTLRKEEKYVIIQEKYEGLPKSQKLEYREVLRGRDLRRYVADWGGLYIRSQRTIPNKPRLLIKDYSKRMTIAYDEGNYRCLRTIYCADILPDINAKYVLGILNSTLLHFYYLSYFYTSRPGMGSFRFRTQFTKRLPIKILNAHSNIVDLTGKAMRSSTELLNLRHKILSFPKPYPAAGMKKLFEVASLLPKFSKDTYKLKRYVKLERSSDVYGKEKFRVYLAKEEYIEFDSIEDAEYLYEVLRRKEKVTKKELLSTQIPADTKSILNEYCKDVEKITSLKKEIREIDEKIDNLAYEIYGITDGERKVIEEYVKRLG